jgi:Mn2+/Fe2+ NRAMP family transporter
MMKSDVAIGMALSQSVMWAIIITTANLNSNNVTNIQTADQVVGSLQDIVEGFPAAGEISKMVFAIGIVGAGLLAIPVLSGSSGYVLSEALGWKEGFSKKFHKLRIFD